MAQQIPMPLQTRPACSSHGCRPSHARLHLVTHKRQRQRLACRAAVAAPAGLAQLPGLVSLLGCCLTACWPTRARHRGACAGRVARWSRRAGTCLSPSQVCRWAPAPCASSRRRLRARVDADLSVQGRGKKGMTPEALAQFEAAAAVLIQQGGVKVRGRPARGQHRQLARLHCDACSRPGSDACARPPCGPKARLARSTSDSSLQQATSSRAAPSAGLLAACAPLGRGHTQHTGTCAQDPTRSGLLDGKWRLLFTTRPGSASPIQRAFVGVDAFSVFQEITLRKGTDARVNNIVDFGPAVGQLKVRQALLPSPAQLDQRGAGPACPPCALCQPAGSGCPMQRERVQQLRACIVHDLIC